MKENEIIEKVCSYFGVNVKCKSAKKEVAFPRMICAYSLFVFTDMKMSHIAKELGYANHSSAYTSVKTIKNLCTYDQQIRSQVIEIESMFE
jgi:chromosomal replication initiation ATPase DnaA